jgi:DNA helicase-2/ATP-dependent DNA helicase PcrA
MTNNNVIPMNKTELLEGLNSSQLKAATAINGAIQICAVAGSGKTRVLTRRTAYMINVLGIPAEQLALMTFTKKASQEMETRLKELISKKDLETMFCGTSHSFGYKVLAREYREMNHPLADFANPKRDKKNPGVLMNNSQVWFAEEVQKNLLNSYLDKDVKDYIKSTGLKSFLSVISKAKNAGMDCYDFERKYANDGTASAWAYIEFYKQYENMKNARQAIDADDMLFNTVRLFQENPAILKKYQRKIKYIMIDETQDNNPTQYELAKMLVYPENNIFVVGDDDQSMYSFRGAEPNLFVNFDKIFPEVQRIGLEDNYRSTADILNKANKLIANNQNRIVKQLVPHNQSQDKSVFYSHYDNEIVEADNVVREIQAVHEQRGLKYNDIFVLYRTNAQVKEMEDALIMAGIPYIIHNGFSFYDRKEVKDILSYLRLVNDVNDDEAFTRVYNVPSRYLGKAYLDKLKAVKGHSLWEATDIVNLTKSEQTGTTAFKQLVEHMRFMHENGAKVADIIEYLLDNGYNEHLKKSVNEQEDETDSIDEKINPVVEKLLYFATRFEKLNQLLDYVSLMANKRKNGVVNGVQLMTIHRSKGLEAKVVFGIGINENLLPHYKSIEAEACGDSSAIEEERRLAYVLVTRAEELCYLSSTTSFNGKAGGTSRFINEMELEADNKKEESKEQTA